MIINPALCDHPDCDCQEPKWWSGWIGSQVHVVPVNDLQPHTTICACEPVREMCVADDGAHGFCVWHVIHNSYDGRD